MRQADGPTLIIPLARLASKVLRGDCRRRAELARCRVAAYNTGGPLMERLLNPGFRNH